MTCRIFKSSSGGLKRPRDEKSKEEDSVDAEFFSKLSNPEAGREIEVANPSVLPPETSDPGKVPAPEMSDKVMLAPTKEIAAESSDSGAEKSPEKKVPKISGKLFSKSRRKKSVESVPVNFSKPVTDEVSATQQQNLFKVEDNLSSLSVLRYMRVS